MAAEWQLAQVNIGRFHKPADHADNADFMNNLDRVNAIAEASPGFVWRLKGEGNSATDLQAFPDPLVITNMSVWESVDALAAFAYRNMDHRAIMRRRREWFAETPVYMALWWVRAGTVPTLEDAKAKLELLEQLGPTQDAFTFKQPFPAPDGVGVKPVLDECA